MGTMQGWVTRNRLREEQEQAKIEQARKEGFDDGYLAGKTFAGMEIASLRAKLEAVPVDEIRRLASATMLRSDLACIFRWLSTVTK